MNRLPLVLLFALAACGNHYECNRGDDGCMCTSNGDCDGMGLVCENGTCVSHPVVKRVFATSAGYPGDLGGMKGADGLCSVVAKGTKLTGTWVAWLSTSKEDAADHVKNVAPWYLMDLTTVAFATSDDLRRMPSVVITRDEGNQDLSTNQLGVWTGTTDGKLSGSACGDWTGDATSTGSVGSLLSPATWTSTGASVTCDQPNRLYCFEQ
jgi:hypothetical protein